LQGDPEGTNLANKEMIPSKAECGYTAAKKVFLEISLITRRDQSLGNDLILPREKRKTNVCM